MPDAFDIGELDAPGHCGDGSDHPAFDEVADATDAEDEGSCDDQAVDQHQQRCRGQPCRQHGGENRTDQHAMTGHAAAPELRNLGRVLPVPIPFIDGDIEDARAGENEGCEDHAGEKHLARRPAQ